LGGGGVGIYNCICLRFDILIFINENILKLILALQL
jgi:hypothetical protein